ncbi:MAG: class I SAM-dependent methyltransferase [Acidobacteriia bacterium]|nr:class I SAM-dependent methyltransferase [Terriglobia bacterium]
MAELGFLDSVETSGIRGWAFDDQNPMSPATVDICINGVVLATIKCSEFRQDLADAQIGNGWHGFSYRLPQRDGDLTVRFTGGGPVLNNGECVLPGLAYRLLISSVLAKGLWCIDNLSLSDTELTIAGWCVPPRALPVPVALTHNGGTLHLTRHRRDDVAPMLGLVRDETGFGFKARGSFSRISEHEFSFDHARTKRPFDPNQTIHYIEIGKPLPPAALRVRVHGAEEALSFVREGSSAFVRLQRVLSEYFSKSITDFSHVLDWGCGSGRVLRYFADSTTMKVTGIDIDPQAIEWCQEAFPRCEFMAVSPEPPTPLATETVDLIYAISVLTHLRENDHLKWLEELHRISKPNAVILLTTFGDTAWWRGRLPWNLYATWRTDNTGFFDVGKNRDIDEVGLADRDYYRNVFVSHEYISRNWSKYFDIVDILPGAIGNLQDLCILERR